MQNKNKHITFEEYKSKREKGEIKSPKEVYTIFDLFNDYLEYIKK